MFEAARRRRSIDVDTDRRSSATRRRRRAHELRCRIVAGCDGFHGVCRDRSVARPARCTTATTRSPGSASSPRRRRRSDELIYASHDRGFALYSMRSPTITRLYLQVPADERHRRTGPTTASGPSWRRRLPTADGFTLNTGPILEKGITAMRSFVSTPMRHGNLVLAGDAAHIVPPTGAKGMNLAIADVAVLADILDDVLSRGRDRAPRRLHRRPACAGCGGRQHFSWWMTSMLHRFDDDPFQPPAAAVRAAPRDVVDGRGDRPRRELRRAALGLLGARHAFPGHAGRCGRPRTLVARIDDVPT